MTRSTIPQNAVARMPPWKRPKPNGKSVPLSAEAKAAAKARAERAGRRYPNLVDNLWASRQAKR